MCNSNFWISQHGRTLNTHEILTTVRVTISSGGNQLYQQTFTRTYTRNTLNGAGCGVCTYATVTSRCAGLQPDEAPQAATRTFDCTGVWPESHVHDPSSPRVDRRGGVGVHERRRRQAGVRADATGAGRGRSAARRGRAAARGQRLPATAARGTATRRRPATARRLSAARGGTAGLSSRPTRRRAGTISARAVSGSVRQAVPVRELTSRRRPGRPRWSTARARGC